MHIYKYTMKRYADLLTEEGEMVISSNRYFREQYERMPKRNVIINDPFEGVTILDQTEALIPGQVGAAEKEILRQCFDIDADQNKHSILRCNRISWSIPNSFMVCFTKLGPPLGNSTFCKSQSGFGEPYDVCVEVRKLSRFFQALAETRTGYDLSNGKRIDMIKCFEAKIYPREVSYRPLVQSWKDGIQDPTPFRKDTVYSSQSEYRIAYHPVNDPECDRIILKSPQICKYLRRVL